MWSLKFKDVKRRNSFLRKELKLKALKYFFITKLYSKEELRKKTITFYLRKVTSFSKTRLQRRCLITNRSKVSNRKLGISRIKLREMLKFNIFPGYKKAIW